MAHDTADIVIVGAGIMGLSIAYQIVRRTDHYRIKIFEKAPNVGEGSTGASSSILRQRYSYPDPIKVARDGHTTYKNWAKYTGLEEPRAEFHHTGVLWMMGETREVVQEFHDLMSGLGVKVSVLDPEGVHERFPSLSTCGEHFDLSFEEDHTCEDGEAFLYEEEGAYFDPVSACQDLLEAVRREGVEVRFKSPVVRVRTLGGRIEGVDLADDTQIDAPMVVNAAGPWATRLANMAGLDLGWKLRPIRVQVIYRESPPELMPIPTVVDRSSGIYFRPENRGQQILIGSILEKDEQEEVDPDDFNQNIDRAFRDTKIYGLHHRIPDLPYRGHITGVSGLYTVNADDVYPIIGPTPIEGFVVANGFSGHGFKEASSVGSMIAQWLTGKTIEFDTDADMAFFSIDRKPHALAEKSVLA